MENITKDPAYNAVDPSDFPAMLDVNRYGQRSTAFDKIISATHDHFWDPLDMKYIDFHQPFDMEKEYLINPGLNGDLKTAIADKLDEKGKIKLVNLDMSWTMSSILHGEQGALSLSASLCHILRDPGAQEYAANQTREEARHVTAFSKYIHARWGKPVQVGPALGDLLNDIVLSPLVWKKIVGMQMLIEGLAMGAFASLWKEARDPLLRQVCQLVMTDEAFHHKFGKIWADRTIPHLSKAEHELIEDWAAQVFQVLLFNLGSPNQKEWIYREVGLDPVWCQQAFMEALTDAAIRKDMEEATNIFRVLIKTLLKAGIITDRTRGIYAAYVDMAELYAEGDRMVGDDIAEEGIRYLVALNGGKMTAPSLMMAAE
ncbi:MAG: ferritin-like domain-containing protein [Alphaproteobacteria bacterium]|nr:ferritin-like domain-containing protein [Alphaproteobacteria bacterium]MBV9063947.1 ferritin-like domain-containing protein [Alphaproteobacteria bacterium]